MMHAPTIRAMETIYWNPINAVRNRRPLRDSPKFPFSTSAGGKEVIYQAG